MKKHKLIIVLVMILSQYTLKSQPLDTVSQKILDSNFKQFTIPKKQKKTFLEPNSSLLTKLNPITYISGGLLFLYQNVASEQIQANCQYHVSCSENMKVSIKRKGLFLGVLKGLNQLGNCASGITKDYPDYKITEDGKVNNVIE